MRKVRVIQTNVISTREAFDLVKRAETADQLKTMVRERFCWLAAAFEAYDLSVGSEVEIVDTYQDGWVSIKVKGETLHVPKECLEKI